MALARGAKQEAGPKPFCKGLLMKKSSVARAIAIAAQSVILIDAAGLSRAQSPPPQGVQPSTSLGNPGNPYAYAFAGLTYTDDQREAIDKIRQDIASRKVVVMKDGKLTDGQKSAMLTGYTRMGYGLIYKELTPQQQKQVSTRFHALHASDAAEKTPAPGR